MKKNLTKIVLGLLLGGVSLAQASSDVFNNLGKVATVGSGYFLGPWLELQ